MLGLCPRGAGGLLCQLAPTSAHAGCARAQGTAWGSTVGWEQAPTGATLRALPCLHTWPVRDHIGTGDPQQGGDDGPWLWPHPGAVLGVALALPSTASAAPGRTETTAQLVPPGRATLASHPLQLLKASEQLLIVPGAANGIITARRWEPLPGPAPAWPLSTAGTGSGSHRIWGAPRAPQGSLTPLHPSPLAHAAICLLVIAALLAMRAPWLGGTGVRATPCVQGLHGEGRGRILQG